MIDTSSAIIKIIGYIFPKNTYNYLIVAAGTFSLWLLSQEKSNWLLGFFPVIIVLLISTIFCIRGKIIYAKLEYNRVIEYVRSFGVSMGTLCIALAATKVLSSPHEGCERYWFFWLAYGVSLLQIFICGSFFLIRKVRKFSHEEVNIGEIALVMAIYLLGTTFVAIYITVKVCVSATFAEEWWQYFLLPDLKYSICTLVALASLWALCAATWVLHLIRALKLEFKLRDIDNVHR